MATGKYDQVVRRWGGWGDYDTVAYAKTNIWEYFGCISESFFSTTNLWDDFAPYDNASLQEFDPDGYNMLVQIYGTYGSESQVL